MRCEKVSDYSNDKDFWNYAYENIPTVTYEEMVSGNYNSSYVCIDGIVLYNDSELLVAFPDSSESYSDNGFLTDEAIGNDLLENDKISAGDSVKLCVYIKNGSPLYSLKAIQAIDKSFDLDIQAYIEERNNRLETARGESNTVVDTETTVSSETSAETSNETTAAVGSSSEKSSKPVPNSLEYGQLLDANPKGGVNMNSLIIKAKIEPNLTNRLTITQNYQNIIKMIQGGDYTEYDEIQYWAIADMSDGSEEKVISFTVDKSCIGSVSDGTIASGDTLEKDLTDLWILPSLQE